MAVQLSTQYNLSCNECLEETNLIYQLILFDGRLSFERKISYVKNKQDILCIYIQLLISIFKLYRLFQLFTVFFSKIECVDSVTAKKLSNNKIKKYILTDTSF